MKLLKTVALCLALILLLVGCGEGKQVDSPDKIALQLKSYASESADWTEIKEDKLASYFGFGGELLDDFSVYINSSEEYFDVIAVFKISDKDNREEVIKGINFMATTSGANYALASEAQSKKITDKVVAEVEDTLILCIIDNYSQIKPYLTEELGAEIIL